MYIRRQLTTKDITCLYKDKIMHAIQGQIQGGRNPTHPATKNSDFGMDDVGIDGPAKNTKGQCCCDGRELHSGSDEDD